MTTKVAATIEIVKAFQSDNAGSRWHDASVTTGDRNAQDAAALIERLEAAAACLGTRAMRGQKVGSFRLLSERAGLNPTTANSLVGRLRLPDPSFPELGTLYKLADAAGVRREWLLCGVDPMMADSGAVHAAESVDDDDAKVSLTARIVPALPPAPASAKRKRRRA